VVAVPQPGQPESQISIGRIRQWNRHVSFGTRTIRHAALGTVVALGGRGGGTVIVAQPQEHAVPGMLLDIPYKAQVLQQGHSFQSERSGLSLYVALVLGPLIHAPCTQTTKIVLGDVTMSVFAHKSLQLVVALHPRRLVRLGPLKVEPFQGGHAIVGQCAAAAAIAATTSTIETFLIFSSLIAHPNGQSGVGFVQSARQWDARVPVHPHKVLQLAIVPRPRRRTDAPTKTQVRQCLILPWRQDFWLVGLGGHTVATAVAATNSR
jgi:hypothetical protein